MSFTQKCLKCNIERDSREYKFIMYNKHSLCHLCNNDAIYTTCLLCEKDFSESLDSEIIPARSAMPNVCYKCIKCSKKECSSYISEIFTVLGKQATNNSEKHENSIKELETELKYQHKKYAVEEANKKIEQIEQTYEQLINEKLAELDKKYDKKINEKLAELDKKYDDLITGDDYDIINVFENKTEFLKKENIGLEEEKTIFNDKIIVQKNQIDDFELLDNTYQNLTNQLSELTVLKPKTPVCDMVHLYKCISDIQDQIDEIDKSRILYIDTCKDITSNKEHVSNLTNTLDKNKQKINRMQHFTQVSQ
jgi:hypothetical protein